MGNEDYIYNKGFDDVVAASHGLPSSTSEGLRWYCAPDSWNVVPDDVAGVVSSREGYGGKWDVIPNQNSDGTTSRKLVVYPPAKKDYWRKTYYAPILVKDDGPFLYYELPNSNDKVKSSEGENEQEHYTITTSFTLTASKQFDQAGLLIRVDRDHWLKTGIEVVDRVPRLSCVVTNIYSDWSTQVWEKSKIEASADDDCIVVNCDIRIHCRDYNSYVVEAKDPEKMTWEFIRIAHLSKHVRHDQDPLANHPTVIQSNEKGSTNSIEKATTPKEGCIWVGIYAACPEDQEGKCNALFHNFTIQRGSSFEHNAENNY